MKALSKLTVVELKLFLREPTALAFTVGLPTILLIALGSIPATREPSEEMGGLSFVDFFVPSLVVITLVILALQVLPVALATYREKGVLRRMGTTPVNPALVLAAQLIVYALVAVTGIGALIGVGRLGFGVPVPQHILGFAAAFLLGMSALFALGLVVAAVAPTSRVASGLGMVLFFGAMFLGGVYLPRFLLPDALVRIGEFMPPGVGALQDAWTGTGPQVPHLAAMAAITLAASATAARLFRWE